MIIFMTLFNLLFLELKPNNTIYAETQNMSNENQKPRKIKKMDNL